MSDFNTLTPKQVIDIIKPGEFPYRLQFFQREQKFILYPSIEVLLISSDSNTTDVLKTQIDTVFEVRLFIKYNRRDEFEEADRIAIESEIIDLLEDANIPPPNEIIMEQKTWNSSLLDTEIYGKKSTLRFTYRDYKSTTGDGITGLGNFIELFTDTDPLQIKMLSFNSTEGATVDSHSIDSGEVQYDPRELREFEITVTYENTFEIAKALKTATDSREEINGRLLRNGQIRNFTYLLGTTTKAGQYTEMEKATTSFYVTGIWSGKTLLESGYDAILT